MSAPSAEELLEHMREAANQMLVYVEGMNRDDFLADRRTQQAVTLNLVILGEAAAKLMDLHPAETDCRPEIEWRAIRGMRNRIAHGYYDINLEVVWQTVQTELPELIRQL